MLKFILVILDGFGLRKETENNAIALANTPNIDKLMENYPMAKLQTSGHAVGLPKGVMGNSEVGHTNIGAGRIVRQDLVRINDNIDTDTLKFNGELKKIFHKTLNNKSTLHLIGLLSDGGVHSHIDHLKYLIKSAKEFGINDIVIHAFMDGRDTPPQSGKKYLDDLQSFLDGLGVGKIASICGRFYAMDRDNRWERVENAYQMLVNGKGEHFDDAKYAIDSSYNKKEYDEFVKPKIIGNGKMIKNGDSVISFNYRADRMREISRAFTESNFSEFNITPVDFNYVSMTQYQESFNFPVLFPPEKLTEIFPEILSKNGFTQLRIAETEKYAHVTYFLNGGYEHVYEGEDRILVPSPKVTTYDLQPEMSAKEVTENVIDAIKFDKYGSIILNFANADMVGHTGILSAAISAIETVDTCVGEIITEVHKKSATMFLTADHGNSEMMLDPETGIPHTAHTLGPVPFVMVTTNKNLSLKTEGKLSDIAPTILSFLSLDQPIVMTGNNLLIRRK